MTGSCPTGGPCTSVHEQTFTQVLLTQGWCLSHQVMTAGASPDFHRCQRRLNETLLCSTRWSIWGQEHVWLSKAQAEKHASDYWSIMRKQGSLIVDQYEEVQVQKVCRRLIFTAPSCVICMTLINSKWLPAVITNRFLKLVFHFLHDLFPFYLWTYIFLHSLFALSSIFSFSSVRFRNDFSFQGFCLNSCLTVKPGLSWKWAGTHWGVLFMALIHGL